MIARAKGLPVDIYFNTWEINLSLATFVGSPAVAVYKGNSGTPITTGVTLDVNHIGTGLHHVRVITTDAIYDIDTDYSIAVTQGTVDGVDVTGVKLAEFRLVSSAIDANIESIGGDPIEVSPTPGVMIVDARYVNGAEVFTSDGIAQAGTSTTITLASGESAQDDIYNKRTIDIITGTGSGQSTVIVDYNGTTKVATVDPAFAISPNNTSEYLLGPIVGFYDNAYQAVGLPQRGGPMVVAWYKNGRDIDTDDVVSPTYVIRSADGTEIIAGNMVKANGVISVEVLSTPLSPSGVYQLFASATIDGLTRTSKFPIIVK